MSSGLIYAVIVGLWAVVLVPMWLRRHDEVSESRSVDRFQGAMRTLSRRSAAGDRREVLRHRSTPAAAARPDGISASSAPRRPARPARPARVSGAEVRRRRALAVLAGLALLVAVLAVAGLVPWWAVVAPVVLLAGFVARARVAAQRHTARALQERRARAAVARRERDAAVASRHRQAGTSPRAEPAAVPVAGPVVAAVDAVATPVLPVAEPDPLYDAVAERVWEPVPVPLPTYVTAPKAPRSVRVIDLTLPGAWTSGHLTEEEQAAVADEVAAVRDPDSIVTGELLVERRRAVND